MIYQSFVDQVLRHYAFHLTLEEDETILVVLAGGVVSEYPCHQISG